jgi:hypothetical protein
MWYKCALFFIVPFCLTACLTTSRETHDFKITGNIGSDPVSLYGHGTTKGESNSGPDMKDVGQAVSTATGILGVALPGPWAPIISGLGGLLGGMMQQRRAGQQRLEEQQADIDSALSHIPLEHAAVVKDHLGKQKQARAEAKKRVKNG